MKSYKESIDKAFEEKKLFFKPWIGESYSGGVVFKGASIPVKTLVIGASRYCRYLHNNKDFHCKHLDKCRNCYDYDTLIQFANDCPYANSLGEKYSLFDINSATISREKIEAYSFFADKLSGMLDREISSANVWQSISFINYLQQIVPEINTPKRSNSSTFYEQSDPIIETILDIIQPDIIILWCPKTFMNNIYSGRLFKNCPNYKLKKEDHASYYILSKEGREIPLFPSPHPSANNKIILWENLQSSIESYFR